MEICGILLHEKTALAGWFSDEFSYENVNLYKGKLAISISTFECLYQTDDLLYLFDVFNIQNKCVRIMSDFENISKILILFF